MKVHVDSKQLSAALKTVAPASKGGGTLPILSGVLLTVADGGLTVEASNLDLTIRHRVECDVAEDGVAVVSAATAARLLQATSGGRVTVELDDHVVRFTGSGATGQAPVLDPDEWPALDLSGLGEGLTLSADDVDVLRHVVYAASTDQSRPVLCGVQFRDGLVQATDSYRGAFGHIPMGVTANVPASAFKAMLSHVDAGEEAHLRLSPKLAEFTAGATTWTTRLIEQEAPNLAQLWRTESPVTVEVSSADLVDAVDRAGSLADDGVPIRLHGDTEHLTVSTSSADVGTATVEVPYTGGEITVGFKREQLADALDHIVDDTAVLGFVDARKPLLVQSAGVSHIVMPVKLLEGAA